MKQSINIVLSGGGTGGHIYPAVAIANEFKQRYPETKFLFVGANDRMEMEKVPQSGYKIEGLWISGLQRKLTLKNLLFPFKLISSLWRANSIIKRFKPDVVIGTGGFASGPTLYIAAFKKIPTLIQEQNSYPGITNKLLSNKVDKICVAYDGLERFFPAEKVVKTGNPVRQDLLQIEENKKEAASFFDINLNIKTILILGGSLGAKAINQLIEKNLEWLLEQEVQLIWQTGKLYIDQFNKYNELKNVQTYAFLNRMDLAYAAADIIISRAGAGSISELCIVGKPVLFIPSPNVTEDHQTKNAEAIVNNKAALMLKENNKESFPNIMSELIHNEDKQKELSINIKKMELPKATEQIVNEIEKLIKLDENK